MSEELPEPIKRVEMYYNADREPVKKIEQASFKYVTIFNENGEIEEQYQVEIIDGIDPELEEASEYNIAHEPAGSGKGGQFAKKEGGSVSDYKEKKSKEIIPTEEEKVKLTKVDNEITNNVRNVINELGYGDKIKFVEMQGSYAKETDLAGSSDLDLFIGFDKSVPREEFERMGLEIGQKALAEYKPYERYAEHPFTEAFVGDVEVQIVPAYDISLEDIKNRQMLSATDRTPHQTRFMNQALSKEQKQDVRLLKKFMRESRVYGSDEKIKGFSGYSVESLIHELGSFENTVDFFANFEKNKVLGNTESKYYTPFTLMDPIDPHRNLVKAFSDQKIARMIKTSREFLKTGEIPKPTTTKMDSIGIKIKYNDRSDDKLYGEINKSIGSIQDKLKDSGYPTKTESEKITGDFEVDVPRTSFNVDKENKEVTINFGLEQFENKEPVKITGPPIRFGSAVQAFREQNPDSRIEEETIDGEKRLVRYVERGQQNAKSSLNNLLSKRLNNLGLSKGILKDIEDNGFTIEDKREKEFENLV